MARVRIAQSGPAGRPEPDEIVLFKTVRFETTLISVLNCNTSTQVASTGNLPPPFLTLAYNPYRLPEMDLAFRLE